MTSFHKNGIFHQIVSMNFQSDQPSTLEAILHLLSIKKKILFNLKSIFAFSLKTTLTAIIPGNGVFSPSEENMKNTFKVFSPLTWYSKWRHDLDANVKYRTPEILNAHNFVERNSFLIYQMFNFVNLECLGQKNRPLSVCPWKKLLLVLAAKSWWN